MSLPIDRTAKSTLDTNLVNGNTSDAPVVKASNDVVYNTVDELYNYTSGLVAGGVLQPYPAFLSRQAVINGNMDIWNEGASIDVGAGGKYVPEMWRVITGGAIYNISRQAITDLIGSENCVRITYKTVGSNDAYFTQGFESDVFQKLKGKKATVSFKARKNGTVIALGVWLSKTATEANHQTGTLIGASGDFTTTVTTTWQTFSFTIDMPITSDTNKGLQLVFRTVMTNINEYIEINQVEINSGDKALPFQPRSFAEEQALSQRFYEKSYSYAIVPATASSTANLETKILPSNTIAASQTYGSVPFKNKKRITPTITVYPFTTPSNTGQVSGIGGIDLGVNSGTAIQGGDSGFTVQNTSGAALTTSGFAVIFHWVADARI